MNTRTSGFAVLLVVLGGLQNIASASRYEDGAQFGYDLGSGGGVDTDNVFQFCPDNFPTCLPTGFVATDILVNYSNFGMLSNDIVVTVDVYDGFQGAPLLYSALPCSGPLAPGDGRTGNDFLCALPSPLLIDRSIAWDTHATSNGLLFGNVNNMTNFGLYTANPDDPFDFVPGPNQGRVTFSLIGDVATPEPATAAVMAAGLGGLLALRRRTSRLT